MAKGIVVGEIIGPTAGLLIFAIILGLVLYKVSELTSPEQPHLDFLSRDMALFIDQISAAPGKVDVMYNPQREKAYEFSYDFSNKVLVKWKGKESSHPITATVSPAKYDFNGRFIIPRFVKTGQKIYAYTADDAREININKLDCEKIDITSISIDPGHGGRDTGLTDGRAESILVREAAQGFEALSKKYGKKFTSTRDLGQEMDTSTDERINAAGNNAVISIHTGKANVIKAFINKNPESEALACNLLNGLTKKMGFDGVIIVPVDTNHLNENDPKRILSVKAPAALLEIDSIQTFDPVQVAEGLSEAMK